MTQDMKEAKKLFNKFAKKYRENPNGTYILSVSNRNVGALLDKAFEDNNMNITYYYIVEEELL